VKEKFAFRGISGELSSAAVETIALAV
jgi:hypothetical protein